jgi:rubrerythrin
MKRFESSFKELFALQAEVDGNLRIAELFRSSSQEDREEMGDSLHLQSVLQRIENSQFETSLYEESEDVLNNVQEVDYYSCTVCGYVREERPQENCPMCSAVPSAYHKVT